MHIYKGCQIVKKYVTYRRVSTREQGKSGLGLEAQARDIALFLDNYSPTPWEVVGEFVEVHSAADAARPQLANALALCRKTGAELLVAKLDRLSRDVEHIAGLLKDKRVTFRCANMPNADKFQLHIYAALAEQERDFIGARTKAALSVAKARGAKLGGNRGNIDQANKAAVEAANAAADRIASIILPMRENSTLQQIADALNAANVPTPRKGKWYPTSVRNALARLAA